MATTTFYAGQTPITADWLNDVDEKTYNDDSSLIPYTPAGTGAAATTVQAKLRESVSVLDFGAVGSGDESGNLQAASDAVGTGTLFVADGAYTGSFSTCANLVFSENAFLTGTVTVTGAASVKMESVRASCIKIESDVTSFKARLVYADGSFYTGAAGLPGIYTTDVIDTVDIDRLYVKNCGGTAQYNSATGFKGNGGALLRIGYLESTNNAYDGFQYARSAGASAYAFERVVLGTLLVTGCGNTTNPAGDNQHHGCYLSSARSISFDKIIVRNQQRGYGIKFGSSTASSTGMIHGAVIEINGITNGMGGITFAEGVGSFQVATGRISNVVTSHVQIGGAASGDFSFGSMCFIEEARTTTSQESFLVAVSVDSLNISGCLFKGWLDGSTRRGIGAAVKMEEGITVGSLVSHGTRFETIAGDCYLATASVAGVGTIINNISIMGPIMQNVGGVISIPNGISSADVLRGVVTGIDAVCGSVTSAWTFPAHSAINVRDNRMRAGATFVRMNDMANSRMSNVTEFDTTYWKDTATGIAVVPATFDMQFPDSSLADGYAGKIYYSGVWKDFGAIV